jgi:hypothetical protein
MKGRNRFKAEEIDQLKSYLRGKQSAPPANAVALPPGEPRQYEPELIRRLTPLLNTTHNPEALRELAELRAECRRIACE